MSYFLKQVPHGYRTSLINGSGFPDALLIDGAEHYLVELKLLEIGPSEDKKLKGLFKPTQPPWYAEYLAKGGTRLYVVFKLEKSYGALKVDKRFVENIDSVRYSDLSQYHYTEYKVLKELIENEFTPPF